MLEILKKIEDIETHLVMSAYARLNIEVETDKSVKYDECLADEVYSNRNQAACISSGSFKTDGMVVVPCSIKTLSATVNSYADSLIIRTADVVLKERRTLALILRKSLFMSATVS